ncbi:MAG: hypothetical protein AAF411_24395, partial [Myxococcota bacterium]
PAPAPRTIAERFSNPPPASDGDEDRTSDDGLDRISLSDALEDGLFTGEGGEDEGEDVERISLSDALAPTDPQPVPRVPKAAPVPQAAPVRKAAPLAPAAPVPAAPVPAGEEPSSNGWLLGVAAIALIGAGGWYVAQQGNAVEPNVANAPSDDSTANPVAETTASNETSAPEPAAPAEPAEPASIRLHGVPTDARAFLDDDFIGAQTSGPLTVSVPQDGERHEISVRVGDDTRWTRSLVATEPLDLLVVIEGLEAAPEPEPEPVAEVTPPDTTPMAAPTPTPMVRAPSTMAPAAMNAAPMNAAAVSRMTAPAAMAGPSMNATMTAPRMATPRMTTPMSEATMMGFNPRIARDPGF